MLEFFKPCRTQSRRLQVQLTLTALCTLQLVRCQIEQEMLRLIVGIGLCKGLNKVILDLRYYTLNQMGVSANNWYEQKFQKDRNHRNVKMKYIHHICDLFILPKLNYSINFKPEVGIYYVTKFKIPVYHICQKQQTKLRIQQLIAEKRKISNMLNKIQSALPEKRQRAAFHILITN